MTTADGTVLGTTKIVDHGLPWQRWDLVIMGDGYRLDELERYMKTLITLLIRYGIRDPLASYGMP